jgi:hypothetical protein
VCFTLFVFVYIRWCATHIMLWFCFVCLHLVSCYLQLFVGGLMCVLRYSCLFTYGGVQHILCCGLQTTGGNKTQGKDNTRHKVKTNKTKPQHNMCWTPLYAVVSNTYYVVVLFCLSSPCVLLPPVVCRRTHV